MPKLDYADIALHCAAAFATIMLVYVIQREATLLMVVANIIFWPVREAKQHNWKMGGTQSKIEAVAPMVVSAAFIPFI